MKRLLPLMMRLALRIARVKPALRLLLAFSLQLPAFSLLPAQPDRAAYAEGMRALRANDAPTAVNRFERAIAINDRVGEYHLRLGLALGQEAFSANPVRQALIARRVKQSFERAVELDPSLVEAR